VTSIGRNLLIAGVFVRLLLPPGICICQSGAPLARLIAALLGPVVPPAEAEDEEDHDPGCPKSKLSAGMGLRPPVVLPAPPAACADGPVLPVAASLDGTDQPLDPSAADPPPDDPALAVRALLI
jgi:hypothetical protein